MQRRNVEIVLLIFMYSPILLSHFEHPRHTGHLDNPSAIGIAGTPGNGPFMVLFLSAAGGRFTDAAYQTYGCAPAIAAGSLLCDWLIGRSLEECRALTEPQLAEMLGGLPVHKRHCSALAVAALQCALIRLTGGECDPSSLAE